MIEVIRKIDRVLAVATDRLCSALLAMLTLVVLYSVVLRYVFAQPPFWSDVVSIFGNIGIILLGLSLTVRDRELIAMQALYERLSKVLALVLDGIWNVMVLVFAGIFTWYGLEAAMAVPGFYWELGMMPQRYPMMIVPISGVLLIIACLGVLVQDVCKLMMLRAAARGETAEVDD